MGVGRRLRESRSSYRLVVLAALAAVALSACAETRPVRPADIDVPRGFKIEAAVKNLAAPTMVAFDDQERMLIAESGYRGGGRAKVTRIEADGSRTVLADESAFGDEVPVTAVAFHEGTVYVSHAGTVSALEPAGGLRPVIAGLPGQGDHQANQIVFSGGFLHVAVGTVTNSSVVGPDNAVFGWLNKAKLRQLHDQPCFDVRLSGEVFDSENPLGNDPERQQTTPYSPYGTVLPRGATVRGTPKCNGAVLRARPDGSDLEVFAWGLRNPYGLELGPDGSLYATNHGFDARGSRPIEDAWDCFYRLQQGAWYGWPDFACDVPVTDDRFAVRNKPRPSLVLLGHPTDTPPTPIAKFDPHSATNGFAFAPSEEWGGPDTAYIALFGDFTPATGTTTRPEGVKIVKVDTRTGAVSEFIDNATAGQASRHSGGGLEHPSDVTFGPDGAMYITDWSVARVSEIGLKLEPDTGVVWKVTRGRAERPFPGGITILYVIAGTAALAVLTVFLGVGRVRSRRPAAGLLAGAVAGAVMGAFTMFVAAPILDLPWHAPPRVLATMVMGRDAVANILEFDLVPFLVGAGVLVVLTVALGAVFAALVRAQQRVRIVLAAVAFALTGWAVLQYFLFPLLFPLVTEKGFTPEWYAASFAVYGLVLGLLVAASPPSEAAEGPEPAVGAPPPPPPTGRREAPAAPESDLEGWAERMRRLREGG